MSIAARLERPGEPAVVERVVIKNISTHGACVVAKRSCRVDDCVVISDLLGTFRIDARVIYCSESLSAGECAIGLRFSEGGPVYVGWLSSGAIPGYSVVTLSQPAPPRKGVPRSSNRTDAEGISLFLVRRDAPRLTL